MSVEKNKKAVDDAIIRLFSDRQSSKESVIDALEEILEDLEMRIDALKSEK